LSLWGFDVLEIKKWGFYRDLNFIVEKLKEYNGSFSFGGKLIDSLSMGKVSFFIPLTDFMVIARKRK
jgi:hypothetical protein